MAVMIHEYQPGDRVMRLIPPYPFGVVHALDHDMHGEMRPVVEWADGTVSSERRSKLVLDQCPLPMYVDQIIVDHFAKLAPSLVEPGNRDHSPFAGNQSELVQHRFDSRSGFAMPLPRSIYSERGEPLTLMRWENGPTRYELIENWKLMSFLDWLDEQAIQDDLDHGREPDRTRRATAFLRSST